MKKFQFILIPILLLSLMMFISCPQEIKPEIPEDKYSTVSFDSFPDTVKEINIYNGDSCIATLHSNYSSKVFRNLEGELKIDVVYKDLTYSDSKYVGYGTLENDENQFTIFLNNRELVNEADFEYTPYYTNPDENIQTNLKLHYTSTFKCTPDLEKLDFTFQNSPKKILKTDVRLRDETIYSYFDCSELDKNLLVNLQEQVGSTVYNFSEVTEGGLYYVNKYSQLLLTIAAAQGCKIIYFDFKADGILLSDDNQTDKIFTHHFYNSREKGQVIKLTGRAPLSNGRRKVEVSPYPEHVNGCYISIENKYSNGFYETENMQNGFSFDYADSDKSSTINLTFYYDSTTEVDAQYGNLSTDKAPLIVYANGQKVTNTYYEPSYNTGDISTNAQFKYEGTFECSEEDALIQITFENSPRLIATNEVRLLDDSNYIYFDTSEVGKDIRIVIRDDFHSDTFISALPLEWYGVNTNHIYTMKRTSPFEIRFWCSSGYDYPELNTFFINNQSILADLQQVPVNQSYDLMYKYDKNCTPGQIIKIKTGDAVQKTSE